MFAEMSAPSQRADFRRELQADAADAAAELEHAIVRREFERARDLARRIRAGQARDIFAGAAVDREQRADRRRRLVVPESLVVRDLHELALGPFVVGMRMLPR